MPHTFKCCLRAAVAVCLPSGFWFFWFSVYQLPVTSYQFSVFKLLAISGTAQFAFQFQLQFIEKLPQCQHPATATSAKCF